MVVSENFEVLLRELEKRITSQRLYARPATVYLRQLVTDGRKRMKARTDLLKAGVIEPHNDPYNDDILTFQVTEKVWDGIESKEVLLITAWDEHHSNEHLRGHTREMPFVALDSKWSPAELKHFITSEYEWYVVSGDPLKYDMCRWTDKPGDDQPADQEKLGRWYGPFPTLDEAHKCLSESFEKGASALSRGFQLVVSSEKLRRYAKEQLFEERLEALYVLHLPWALTTLNILTKEESRVVGCHEERNRIGGGVTFNLGQDPDKWGENAVPCIANGEAEVKRLLKKIAIFEKMEKGISNFGGWDKFQAEYRVTLRASLEEDKQEVA